MPRLRPAATALLLAFVVAAAVLPLAASGERHGCHCAVRMACCENGTCTMGGDEPPADGPEWRTCRREAPASAAAPLDAFERAVKGDFFEGRQRVAPSPLADLAATRPRSNAPGPATPPPRALSF
ncbi:MAG TPA: hypothetical protein VMV60_06435 [Thermoanaerobaculia bacterium]|nr:hypothetical protein [Thermoanaerobaculia bacterium]